MKNLVRQSAANLPVTAPYAVASGQGVQVGALFGFASLDAASGADVTIVRTGEFTHAKAPSQAWTVGQRIYWDNTARVLTNVVGSNLQIGVATRAVAGGAGDTIGAVALGIRTA